MSTYRRSAAFTLVEVLVAASIIVVLMGIMLGMTDQTQRLIRSTSSKVEAFQESRAAFESVTRHLSQACSRSASVAWVRANGATYGLKSEGI